MLFDRRWRASTLTWQWPEREVQLHSLGVYFLFAFISSSTCWCHCGNPISISCAGRPSHVVTGWGQKIIFWGCDLQISTNSIIPWQTGPPTWKNCFKISPPENMCMCVCPRGIINSSSGSWLDGKLLRQMVSEGKADRYCVSVWQPWPDLPFFPKTDKKQIIVNRPTFNFSQSWPVQAR